MISRQERDELNALSLEIFGVKSKWRTILDKGVTKPMMRKHIEVVPGENGADDTTQEVEIPVTTASGAKISHTVRMSVEEVKKMLLDLKAQIDTIKAEREKQIAAAQAAKEQKVLEQKVNEALAGSAV